MNNPSRFTLVAIFALTVSGTTSGQSIAPMAFPPASGTGSLTQNNGSIFKPVEVFPRASDYSSLTVPPLMVCPLLRCSGIFGFRDPANGREYAVSGRSDGLLLMDCTPAFPPGSGQSLTLVTIPSTNQVDWIDEPPTSGTTPGILLSAQPQTTVRGDVMNGFDVDPNSPTFGLFVQDKAYWPPLSPPLNRFPFRTTHTSNREVTVWYDVGADRFWVFSVNTLRAGLWAVPLIRVGGIQRFDDPGAQWLQPTGLGACHHIYLDASSQRLFVTDDWNATTHAVVGLKIVPGGNPIVDLTPAWTYSPTAQRRRWDGQQQAHLLVPESLQAHDAMPVGAYLYVTYGDLWLPDPGTPLDAGWGIIDIISLDSLQLQKRLKLGPPNAPLSGATIPIPHTYQGLQSRWPTLPGSHSVYVDHSNVPEPTLVVTQEDATQVSWNGSSYNPTARVSAVRFAYNDPTGENKFREATQFVQSVGQNPNAGYLPTRMHYLRGKGRTVFVPHYNDGIDLIDLSDIQDQSASGWLTQNMSVLGSYDTSYESQPLAYSYPNSANTLVSANQIQGLLDGFLGCWDAYPHQDSGLVYASCGQSGVALFQVREGQLNRFGAATPFAQGASSLGLYPQIELMSGPAREGRSIVIHDANRTKYTTVGAGSVPVKYTYKLRYSATDQFAIDSVYQPFTTPTPIPAMGSMYLTTSFVDLPFSDSDVVITAPMPARPAMVFGQLIVQEHRYNSTTSTWQATGYWAASQGTWCGVARP